jgi:hypothetical protein
MTGMPATNEKVQVYAAWYDATDSGHLQSLSELLPAETILPTMGLRRKHGERLISRAAGMDGDAHVALMALRQPLRNGTVW